MARFDEALAGEETWGAWWLDQLGHTGLGALYALVGTALGLYVLDMGPWFSLGLGACFALGGGIVREIVQLAKSGELHPADRVLDAVFHLPGAPVALGAVLLVKALL